MTLVGWYAHHLGSGHVARAMTVAPLMRSDVVVLSSAPRPPGLAGGPLGAAAAATTTREEPTMPRAAHCTGHRSATGVTESEWP